MLERIKNGDYKLYKFTLIIMVILIAAALIGALAVFTLADDYGYGFLPLVGGAFICGGIYLNWYISGLFYLAACDKGYDDVVYIRVPYFLGFVGYIFVCALPDKSCLKAEDSDEELPEL